MKKNNHLQKKLKFHCFQCQTLYYLMEVHSQSKPNCPDHCLQKWQDLCHQYFQERVLGYIQQQEEEEWENNEDNLAQQFNKLAKQSKK